MFNLQYSKNLNNLKRHFYYSLTNDVTKLMIFIVRDTAESTEFATHISEFFFSPSIKRS